ncbi:MAG: hypothetical protein GY854_05940 [Deltaproteobacteria bacterium]|nr:hypothetical protein [Deltaproteobacteria bacterium]
MENLIDEETLSLEETSKTMSKYRWVGGWRITDSADHAIYSSGIVIGTPAVFILETATMKIIALEPPDEVNVINTIKSINESN